MAVLVLVTIIVAIDVAGWFWGADSRDGKDWQPLSTLVQ